MRKNRIILGALLLSMLFPMIPQSAEGHGSCTRRFFLFCFPTNQWSVCSRINFSNTVVSQDCSGWQNFPYPYHAYATAAHYAYQWTKYTQGLGCQRYGWVAHPIWGRGEDNSALVNEFIEIVFDGGDDGDVVLPDDYLEESEVVEEEVTFDLESRMLTISGINATLRVKEGEPVISEIRYELWEAADEADDAYSPDKVKYATSLTIKGHEADIITEGEWSDVPVEVYTDETGFRVAQIHNATIQIFVPEYINPCHLGINLMSHAVADAEFVIGASLAVTEKKLLSDNFQFEVYPNPASDLVTVHLQTQDKSTAYITIFDNLGREVHKEGATDLSPHMSQQIRINVQQLPAGQYYIMVNTNDQKYLKTIQITK